MTNIADDSGLITRGLADVVTEAMASARAVASLGPRQAGKSTLARMLARACVKGHSVT